MFFQRKGYRGAIGFKNKSCVYLESVVAKGFKRPVHCRSLKPGEHSFNYLGRQTIPDQVELVWSLGEAENSMKVSLSEIPKDLKDGEIFFVLTADGIWEIEWGHFLDLDKLQGKEETGS